MRGPKLLVGAAVTVAVLGVGVTAFALDGSGGSGAIADPSVTTVAPTTTEPPTEPGPTNPTTAPADDGGGDGSAPVSTVDCPTGMTYQNHGAYVSSVAGDPERAPGDVPAAAQSECGKPLTDGATTEPAGSSDTDSTAGAEPTADAGAGDSAPGRSGTAPGHMK